MRVTIAVALLVVPSVDPNPPERTSLKGSRTKIGQQGRQPTWRLEALVRQQAMETDRDAKAGGQIEENEQCDIHYAGPKKQS
jgi:hypothetical protein